jgi:hypothetical protein
MFILRNSLYNIVAFHARAKKNHMHNSCISSYVRSDILFLSIIFPLICGATVAHMEH